MNHMPFPRRTGVGVGVRWLYLLGAALVGLMFSPLLFAHGVEAGDATFIEQASGAQLLPFIYLGAKHMVTGYDHLLFLAGVIFFLYRMKDVGIYVTLFAVGHSVTLLYGVLSETNVNAYMVDSGFFMGSASPRSSRISRLQRMAWWRTFWRLMLELRLAS